MKPNEGSTALQRHMKSEDLSEAPDDRIWIQLVEPAATAEVQCISYCNMCLRIRSHHNISLQARMTAISGHIWPYHSNCASNYGHMMHHELMNPHALAPRYATRNLLGSTASTILLWKRPAQEAIPSTCILSKQGGKCNDRQHEHED